MYKHMNELWHNELKEIKQELYNNAQNLGECRGPLHQPWQQSSSTNYVWKQSSYIKNAVITGR